MKKPLIAFSVMSLAVAASASTVSISDVNYAGWTDSTFQTFSGTTWGTDWNGTWNLDGSSATVYQSFTAEDSGMVGAVSFMSARFDAGTHYLTVYELFNGDGSTPDAFPTAFNTTDPNYMVELGSFSWDHSGGYLRDRAITLTLDAGEQFAIETGHTYAYGVHTTSLLRMSTTTVAGQEYAGGGIGDTAISDSPDAGVGYTIVPEPAAFAFLGLGMVAFLARRHLGAR